MRADNLRGRLCVKGKGGERNHRARREKEQVTVNAGSHKEGLTYNYNTAHDHEIPDQVFLPGQPRSCFQLAEVFEHKVCVEQDCHLRACEEERGDKSVDFRKQLKEKRPVEEEMVWSQQASVNSDRAHEDCRCDRSAKLIKSA